MNYRHLRRYIPRTMWAEAFWSVAAALTHTLYVQCKTNAVLTERRRTDR